MSRTAVPDGIEWVVSDRVEGVLLVPQGLARGSVRFGATIEDVDHEAPAAEGADRQAWLAAVARGEALLIVPGFVDTHVHGGGGADTMDGAEGVLTAARFHLRHGTTTLLPTTITRPWDEVVRALGGVAEARERARSADEPLPDLPGAHLEGPFLSRARLGAQPDRVVAPDAARVGEILAAEVVRVVTLAPELDGALEAARRFARAGVRVSVGHTDADAETVSELVAALRAEGGTAGFTHLFNAMTPLASRAPGAVGAALAEPDAYAELILDGHHVHPTAFRAALAAKPERLHLITDAIRACGAGEGTSELGGQTVHVAGGAARLPDGTLAGSVLTMDRAFANAIAAGVALERAATLSSAVAARYLGLNDRGSVRVGLRADLVALDGAGRVRSVIAGGRRLEVGA